MRKMKVYSLEFGTLKGFERIGLKRKMVFRLRSTSFTIFFDTLNPRPLRKYMYIAGIFASDPSGTADYWDKHRPHYKYREKAFEMFWKFLKETKQEGEP
jgi:hypothetical protein